MTSIDAEIIHSYTRAQAIEDGVLVAVPEAVVREAGFGCPVALTAAAWADCVTWTAEDAKGKPRYLQDEAGRLWDVLWMTRFAVGHCREIRATVRLHRIPRPGCGSRREVTLVAATGPGDDGEQVITIMQPGED
jgi:hypothetical protein